MMRIIKWIFTIVLGFILTFFIMVFYLSMIRVNDLRLEKRHQKALISYYQDDYEPVFDESEFINFDPTDLNITLSDIQMLASHNSYKKRGPLLGKFFVGLGDSFAEARAMQYGYLSLTKQFEHGIRSMELDIRLRNNQFEITHVPLVDSSSVSVTLKGALNEIKLYSTHNPNHIPMIFLLEIKDDWMMLDPMLNEITPNELIMLNDLIASEMGDYLIRPADIITDGKTLRETIIQDGWPSLNELLGKNIFVIHPGRYSHMFDETFEDANDLSVFIGAYEGDQNKDYASFFVVNTPNPDIIGPLVAQNFMVRTRIDSGLIFTQDRMDLAVSSGAQILTSDFTIGRSDLKMHQMIFLEGYKMVIKKS